MKITILSIGATLAMAFALLELSGCGSPPEAPSAKKEIHNAEGAIESANTLMQHQQYDMAVNEFDNALSEIKKGELFAEGNELTRLGVLKQEARSLKLDCESKARRKAGEASAKLKPAVTAEPVASVESDTTKREAEKAEAAALAANEKAVQDAINKPKASKKVEEPEDTGDVTAAKKNPNATPDADKEPVAAKAAPKDKNGIYPDFTDSAPPFQIFKLTRIGKFVLAYCRYHNNTDDGKNLTIATFFKDHDNQVAVPPLTTAAFPYERFSNKAKDLIGDQPVNNLSPGKEGVDGHRYLDFVTVGECQNEEAAGHVVKVYVKVSFGDGKSEEATFEGAAAALPIPKVKL